MEVGNILRNFCLESTTVCEAARKKGVEREGTWSREGKTEREKTGGQLASGGRGSACFVPFPFAPFCAHFFLITRCHLAMPHQRGKRQGGVGLGGTLLL